jgi:hypothetical protein
MRVKLLKNLADGKDEFSTLAEGMAGKIIVYEFCLIQSAISIKNRRGWVIIR